MLFCAAVRIVLQCGCRRWDPLHKLTQRGAAQMDGTIILKGDGRLTLREEGSLVRLEAERPDDRKGLYKVWLCGWEGKYLLGTLVPDRGRLYLCRRVSRSALEWAGCWPVIGGECVMAFAFQQGECSVPWKPVGDRLGLIKEPVLRKLAQEAGVLYQKRKDGFCLAGRLDSGAPFPIPPLFCFAHVGELRGRRFVFFEFDGDGMPVLPHNEDENGKNSDAT